MSNWQQNYNNTTAPSQGWETPSRSSPQGGGTRGCLCKDGRTYSRKCCDGSLRAQGIGNITGTNTGLQLYNAYEIRVIASGGKVEGRECFIAKLNQLNNITT
jgi:hypothetical protein